MTASTVSRRDFLRLSAGSLGAAGALSAPLTQGSETGGVSIVIDPTDRGAGAPSVAWAVEELQSALSQHATALHRFRTIEEAPQGARCIVASTRDLLLATRALAGVGVTVPHAAESLAIVAASFAGREGLLACGADARGLTYALLELADRIRCAPRPAEALTFEKPLLEKPHHAVR